MRTEKCSRSLAIVPLMALGFLLAISSAGYSLSLTKLLGGGQEPEYSTFRLIHIADLKSLIAADKNSVHIFDANGVQTREKYGIIPGAKLLSSDDSYDLSVLPSNKNAKLVFYCANTH